MPCPRHSGSSVISISRISSGARCTYNRPIGTSPFTTIENVASAKCVR